MNDLTAKLMKRQDVAFLLLRVGVGVIMIAHGASKLAEPAQTAQQFGNMGMPVPELMVALAIAGEFLGGLGLLLGLLTRLAALGPFFTMVVAILVVHAGNGLFAKNNGWEYPLTLLLVSLVFAIRGAGAYSFDAWIAKRRGKPEQHVQDSQAKDQPEASARA